MSNGKKDHYEPEMPLETEEDAETLHEGLQRINDHFAQSKTVEESLGLYEKHMNMANEDQIGGDHYKAEPGEEEHWDRAIRLDHDPLQYIITKWVERWKDKGGLQDLHKAQHAIKKYIEVVKEGKITDHLTPVHEPPRFKEPAEWTQQEQAAVAESVRKHNPLLGSLSGELNNLNQVLGMNCICSTQVPAPEGHIHIWECPARDPLAQPTNKERGEQMHYLMDQLSNRSVNMVSDNEWTYEGGTKDRDEWTCRSCGAHIKTEANYGPPKKCPMHPPEDAAEPTGAYVDQDRPRGVCDHGRAFNDYCEPCGRVNNA